MTIYRRVKEVRDRERRGGGKKRGDSGSDGHCGGNVPEAGV